MRAPEGDDMDASEAKIGIILQKDTLPLALVKHM